VMVLYLGKTMEIAGRDAIYANPRHPYTQALLSAVPVPDPAKARARPRLALAGELPSPLSPPSGCVFRTRCPAATAVCADTAPAREHPSTGHDVWCHHWRTARLDP
jgi:oligopeptide transport system ATP-binding protein